MRLIIAFALVLSASSASAETLVTQTRNGQVSVQKDLDPKLCKTILNKLKCQSNCLCIGVDENGDIKYNQTVSSCSSYGSGSDLVLGECVK